jgi:uncharacterized protein YndB with AHSA1/START domain
MDERTLATARTLPCPPQAVYGAFADPALLAAWWGPEGFSNTFSQFEFAPGGAWVFVMHGPGGQDYANRCRFETLVPARQVVVRHECAPYFTLTVDLADVAGGTALRWTQTFDDATTAQAVRPIVVPANEQNLDRLARVLGL